MFEHYTVATSVLLHDGWHAVEPGSLIVVLLNEEWSDYGFKFQASYNDEWICGPIENILALGYKGTEPQLSGTVQ